MIIRKNEVERITQKKEGKYLLEDTLSNLMINSKDLQYPTSNVKFSSTFLKKICSEENL